MSKSTDVKLIELKMDKASTSFVPDLFKARQLINDFNPDIVHSHMGTCQSICPFVKVKYGNTSVDLYGTFVNEGSRLRMLAYRVTDAVYVISSTNVSQEAVDIEVERGAAPQNVLSPCIMGVNTASFHFDQIKRDQLRPLFCATPDIQHFSCWAINCAKDYPNLLKAFAAFAANVCFGTAGNYWNW